MLPSDLLITRTSKGKIVPRFAPLDKVHIEVAEEIINIFEEFQERKQGDLSEILDELEEGEFDYRFIRGLNALLERRCTFEIKSPIDPVSAREAVFKEANKLETVTTRGRREEVMNRVALSLKISVGDLERSLWADHESELILKEFNTMKPVDLLKSYNLSLAQTLLFKAMSMEISIKSNYQNVFRSIKNLGLMYLVERRDNEKFNVIVEGPLALFKMTERYGTSLAKLLPTITSLGDWTVKANIVRRSFEGTPRILEFVLDHRQGHKLESIKAAKGAFDSMVEKRFSQGFNSLNTGWTLRREPEPLMSGSSIFIPDFSFEKNGMKFYLEIVGFWTEDYLRKKISKLRQIREENLIIAVNENLSCSGFKDIGRERKIILYKKEVPLNIVLNFLDDHEEKNVRREIERLSNLDLEFKKEVTPLREISNEHNVSIEAIRRILKDEEKCTLIGEVVVSRELIKKLRTKMQDLPDGTTRGEAAKLFEAEGITNIDQSLDVLGYTVRWNGLNPENAVIVKKV